jgi:hypothetical protein
VRVEGRLKLMRREGESTAREPKVSNYVHAEEKPYEFEILLDVEQKGW